MNTVRSFVKAFGSISASSLFVVIFGTAAFGQAGRTFVSGGGVDTNPCSLTLPCRTFAQAISQTAQGGEVVVQNSAGYGPFTISHSVAITAPNGVYAGITQASNFGDGIDINAGPSDVVTLKGLTIIGPGGSVSQGLGVSFASGAVLHVEGCEVRGFSDDIQIEAANSQSFIKDTVVKDAGLDGIILFAVNAGTMSGSMDHVTANDNGQDGVAVATDLAGTGAIVKAAIRNSTISGNQNGVAADQETSGNSCEIDIESCLIANNGQALSSVGGAGATVSISNCVISGNLSDFNIENGAAILSRGNNTFRDGSGGAGSLTVLTAR
jgi:hypothetical protein